MKRVSIVMCTYNGEKYLAGQLDSILSQTYPLHEILIQDDGSSDGTVQIIEDYRKRYPVIRLIRNEQNLGYNRNFLTAISKASGDYIAVSDQDDIWDAEKIRMMMEELETSGKEVCFCRSRKFGDDPSRPAPLFDARRPNYGIERMLFGNMSPGHTLLLSRSFANKCTLDLFNQFIQTDQCYYDYFIGALAASYDSLYLCNKVLVHYRRHSQQVTSNQDRGEINPDRALSTMAKAFRLYYARKREMIFSFSEKYRFFSSLPVRNRHMDNALKLAQLFTRRDPLSYIRLTCLCVKLRREIFYTDEVPPLKLLFRSFLFPIYAAIYFQEVDALPKGSGACGPHREEV